jgi:hypothetical protein
MELWTDRPQGVNLISVQLQTTPEDAERQRQQAIAAIAQQRPNAQAAADQQWIVTWSQTTNPPGRMLAMPVSAPTRAEAEEIARSRIRDRIPFLAPFRIHSTERM